MLKQKGSAMIVALCLFGIIAAAGIFLVSHYNSAVRQEAVIKKLEKASETELATFSLAAVEASGVARAHKKDIQDTMEIYMKKYDNTGDLSMLWSNDNIPTPSVEVRLKVQRIIEGGRNNFKVSQQVKLDACEKYEVSLESAGGMFKKMLGFPKIDMDKICSIVSSGHAKEAFETRVDNGIQGLDQ
jgi:hypothetical protein